MKPKLCYILPEYNADAHTHFAYIPPFLERVGGSVSVRLLVERGGCPSLSHVEDIHCKIRQGPLGLFRLGGALISARFSGFRTFYVHYSFQAALVASLIARVSGGKVFYWNCGLPWRYSRPFFRDLFERLTYKLITHLVTGTRGLANQYAKEYGISIEKVKVMPNWIDLEKVGGNKEQGDKEKIRQELEIGAKDKMVLFIHRLSERKGAHYLPEIVSAVSKNVVVVIAGDGPSRRGVEREIESLGLSPRVRFLGWVPHNRAFRLMAAADVFIMPSDEEGFPHVLLEAMALRTPFVATDAGGVKEMVPAEAGRFVVAAGSAKTFLKMLHAALKMHPPARAKIIEENYEHVKQFDTNLVVRHFVSLLYE